MSTDENRVAACLRVASLSILDLADRRDERLPLLLADMAALQPDLLGLREVVYPSDHRGVLAELEVG